MRFTKSTFYLPIYLIFSLGCLFTACKNDSSASANEASTTAAAETAEAPVHVKSERAAVAIGNWQYKIVGGSSAEDKEKYKGRWINVKRDDTFTSGIYDQQTDSGTWTFDDPESIILLKYKNNNEDLYYEWRLQGFGSTTIWMGNTPSNPKGIQIKMEKMPEGEFPEKK